MKCKHVQKHLLDYSESVLDQDTRSHIEEHLRNCPVCAGELREFEQTVKLLQSAPSQEPPEAFWTDLTSNVMGEIHKMGPIQTTRRAFFFPDFKWVAVAIAILLLVFASFFLYFIGAF